MVEFYHDKDIDMLKLGCTFYQNWLTIVYTKLPMQNSIISQREIRTYWKKLEKTSLVGHLSFSYAKQLLMSFIPKSTNICEILLGLTPVNYTPTRCVNPCPPVFIRVGISFQKPVDSHLDKTRPVAWRKWSCFIFNEQDLIVKLGASTLQADRKLTVSVLMGFFSLQHCLKQWVPFTTSVYVMTSTNCHSR